MFKIKENMSIKMYIKSKAKKIPFVRPVWYKYKQIIYCFCHPSFLKINKKNRDGYVIQLVNTLSNNDAIGNCIFEIQTELNKRNIKNCVLYFDTNSKNKGLYPVNIFKFNNKDTLVYHMGSGSGISDIYSKAKVKKKIMVYHNITPSKYFLDNKEMFKGIEKGKKELKELKEFTDIGITVSKYSQNELIELGYKNTFTLGIPTKVPSLLNLKTYKNIDYISFVTVGRIARHKCIHDVIKIFNEINKIESNVKLSIVGSYDNLKYMNELKDLINKFNLKNKINFVFGASNEKLAEIYSNANAYICMSEHEGFCVPLVEAMAFNIPVFAYASSAIPETLNGVGILFYDKNDFKSIAIKIMSTLKDNKKIEEIVKKERIRYKDFDNQKILDNYIKIINSN